MMMYNFENSPVEANRQYSSSQKSPGHHGGRGEQASSAAGGGGAQYCPGCNLWQTAP